MFNINAHEIQHSSLPHSWPRNNSTKMRYEYMVPTDAQWPTMVTQTLVEHFSDLTPSQTSEIKN